MTIHAADATGHEFAPLLRTPDLRVLHHQPFQFMDLLLQRFSDISIGTLSGSTIGRDFPLPSLWF